MIPSQKGKGEPATQVAAFQDCGLPDEETQKGQQHAVTSGEARKWVWSYAPRPVCKVKLDSVEPKFRAALRRPVASHLKRRHRRATPRSDPLKDDLVSRSSGGSQR